MLAAGDRYGRSEGFGPEHADEFFFGSGQDPTPRRALEAAGAGANTCASRRSPRWSAELLDRSGTGLPGWVSGLLQRHTRRHRSPSLAVRRHMHAAGGWQAGAPARSSRSPRPSALDRLHILRHLPMGWAGTSRGVPASPMHSNPPAWDAGVKEETR